MDFYYKKISNRKNPKFSKKIQPPPWDKFTLFSKEIHSEILDNNEYISPLEIKIQVKNIFDYDQDQDSFM